LVDENQIIASFKRIIAPLKAQVVEKFPMLAPSAEATMNIYKKSEKSEQEAGTECIINLKALLNFELHIDHPSGWLNRIVENHYLWMSPQLTRFPILAGIPLRELHLSRTHLRYPPVLTGLINLQDLYLNKCLQLTQPPVVNGLSSLRYFSMAGCENLAEPPILTGLVALEILILSDTAITEPPVLTGLVALRQLHLKNCKNLTRAPNITGLAPNFTIRPLPSD
jgi:hypothetical protein